MSPEISKVRPNRCGAYYLQMMDEGETATFNRFKAVCALRGQTIREGLLELIARESEKLEKLKGVK